MRPLRVVYLRLSANRELILVWETLRQVPQVVPREWGYEGSSKSETQFQQDGNLQKVGTKRKKKLQALQDMPSKSP